MTPFSKKKKKKKKKKIHDSILKNPIQLDPTTLHRGKNNLYMSVFLCYKRYLNQNIGMILDYSYEKSDSPPTIKHSNVDFVFLIDYSEVFSSILSMFNCSVLSI